MCGAGFADDAAAGLSADGSFCAARDAGLMFCDDFDQRPFAASWQGSSVDPGGQAQADDTIAVSPPNAAWCRMVANAPTTPSGCSYAAIWQDFPSATTSAQIEFDLRLTPDDAGVYPDPEAIFFDLLHESHGDLCQLLLHPKYISEQVIPSGGGPWLNYAHDAATSLQVGRFVHLAIHADYGASMLTLSVDGAVTIAEQLHFASCSGPGTTGIKLGVFCDPQPNGASEDFRVDNVILTTN
jgi:hypothetical protein